ncbi:30S ribosomal protein S19e [archaeon]|nr:30S ribosomal protein S19e [archaeon]
MPTMHDVPVNILIEEVAKELHNFNEIKPPVWTVFVKTGMHKERPPKRADWWYVRAAAVLRSVRRLGPVGVEKLRGKYGGRKNMGHKTEHVFKGSGSIIRKVLQQLESAGLIKKGEKGVHKGRIITPKGISLMDKAAVKLYKEMKTAALKKPEHKVEQKPAPTAVAAAPQPEQKKPSPVAQPPKPAPAPAAQPSQ